MANVGNYVWRRWSLVYAWVCVPGLSVNMAKIIIKVNQQLCIPEIKATSDIAFMSIDGEATDNKPTYMPESGVVA